MSQEDDDYIETLERRLAECQAREKVRLREVLLEVLELIPDAELASIFRSMAEELK